MPTITELGEFINEKCGNFHRASFEPHTLKIILLDESDFYPIGGFSITYLELDSLTNWKAVLEKHLINI